MGFGSIKCCKWYYCCQDQSDTKNGMHSFYSATLWHQSVSQKSLCLSVFQILTLQIILVIKMHIVLWLAKLIKCSFLLSYDWLPWQPTAINYWIFSHSWGFHESPLHLNSWCLLWGEVTLRTVRISCLWPHIFIQHNTIWKSVKFLLPITKFKSYWQRHTKYRKIETDQINIAALRN